MYKMLTGKEHAWEDLLMKTLLTADSKTKYFNGDVEGLTFITPTAGRAHVSYLFLFLYFACFSFSYNYIGVVFVNCRRYIRNLSLKSMEMTLLNKKLTILSCGKQHSYRGRKGNARVVYTG